MAETAGRWVSFRRNCVAVLPFGLGAAGVAAAFAGLRDRLPDPLATHFRAGGEADGFTGAGGFLGTVLGVLLGAGALLGLLTHLTRKAPQAQRTIAAVGCGVAVFLGTAFGTVLWANTDAGDAVDATLPGWQVLLVLAAGAAAGALGWWLAGSVAPPAVERRPLSAQAPRIQLAEGELATWTRTVGSRVIPLVGLAICAGGLVAGPTAGWGLGVGLLVGGVPMALLTGARVTVDRRGVSIAPLLLPRPRMFIPVERIEEATDREVDAMRDFGGWGYRLRAGASGVILRSGGALTLRLAHGREFVVTVDDARTAAGLLNAFTARERTPSGD
ncbi:hypothetical protein ACZ90_45100 [Streptomyces albus subsp. albus]|nr:hypothetical protein ACZ90_45100 [Streptomyces albus subsp. albus]